MKAAPRVATFLKHDDPGIRRVAAEAIWKIEKNVAGVSVLVALLSEQWSDTVCSAAEVLGRMGADAKDALPALKMTLMNPNANVKNTARAAIKLIEAVNPIEN